MPLETLKQVLAKWPTSQDVDHSRVLFDLRNFLASHFDQRDLFNVPDGGRWGVISKPLITEAHALFLVHEIANANPNLATLVREQGAWRLQSLKFQCPGCFGTGVLLGRSLEESQPCYLCGATGWGDRSG